MVIYFILIGYVLILPFVLRFFIKDDRKLQQFVALFGMLGIFLVLGLKAPTVGVDISGYYDQYYLAKEVSWSNFDYVYFEKGYVFLEKVFSKSGISFQGFTIFLYGVECTAWYLLISRFSSDAMLSVLSFICYQFFVLSASGLRQALAMAVCIFAYLFFIRDSRFAKVIGLLLIGTAVLIHSSAIFFFIIPIIVWISTRFAAIRLPEIILCVVIAFVIRQTVWIFVNNLIKEVDVNSSIALGGSFLFQVGIMVFSVFTYDTYYHFGLLRNHGLNTAADTVELQDTLEVRLSVIAVAALILLSGGKMLRAAMYINMLLIPLLPNMIQKYRRDQRLVIKVILILFLVILFYKDTLAVNQLAISHYQFFWQVLA